MTHIYTSDEILSAPDLYELSENVNNLVPVYYAMTPDEVVWLEFVRGKYSIADYLLERINDINIVTLDDELSTALDEDCMGWGKATMLSDDTALQKILFWSYVESEA